MLTTLLLLLGAALLALALADRPVSRLPMTPAVIYLLLGLGTGALLGVPGAELLARHAPALKIGVEFVLLLSLFVIGVRLRFSPTLHAWRIALLLAGPGMLVTIALAAVAAWWLLALPWPAALLLGAILAPTDPVLASEVQIRSNAERDKLRLALTAEGGVNDGSAAPIVALAVLLMTQAGADALQRWWWHDLLLPLGGGALLGIGLGYALGHALRARLAAGDSVERDELVAFGSVAIAFGAAHLLGLSTFIAAFAAGATLLLPLRTVPVADAAQELAKRMHDFGGKFERLVEAATVLGVGMMMSSLSITGSDVVFAIALIAVLRPVAVFATVPSGWLPKNQRRLLAWFGIRGIGSLYYLLLALETAAKGAIAERITRVTLLCVALSILLHGISATPLMAAHQRRRKARGEVPPG